MKHFYMSFLVTAICLGVAGYWGGLAGVTIAVILGVMEVSLSFDNAVVNAGILKTWNERWQKLFLGLGIIVAVFGMRLVFPLLIVAVATDISMIDAWKMAINSPDEYAQKLTAHHAEVSAFGGMFLLLVFLNFLFDAEKDTHWIKPLEKRMVRLGNVDSMAVLISMLALLGTMTLVHEPEKLAVLMSGVWGIVAYIGVEVIGHLLEDSGDGEIDGDKEVDANTGATVVKAVSQGSIGGFLYLEVLDASFSFDGVIGAFAITKDIVIIMMGLAIGAMFVRSMTVYLVRQGTLDQYIYLEHGAHYAIGVLAAIMLLSVKYHIPEVVTGVLGVLFIVVAVISSIMERKANEKNGPSAGPSAGQGA